VSLSYRLLGPGDEGVLDRVAEEVFDEPIHPDRARAYLAEPTTLMLVALDGDLVVGQCAAVIHRHPDKPTGLYVDELGVAPGWQRQGIGTELMRRILDEGRARGCEEAWLGTEPDNIAANALYEGLRGSPVETFHLYHYDL
jgi:ribosomal protein S18 acetylase RimI-like enzyme